ncbi:MAG: hypothetical protein OMM_11141, partial [Candidatus Magnetoglobus multicellularis str. Araruama]
MNYKNLSVSLAQVDCPNYPAPPYHPCRSHPELTNLPYSLCPSNNNHNSIYEAVRDCLIKLKLDNRNIETNQWNPFQSFIKPGQNAVLKPNLVFDQHPLGLKGTLCTITHASVLRPLIDYILLATAGNVNISICDVPLQSANWNNLIFLGGYNSLIDFYSSYGINISLIDLRKEIAIFDPLNIIVKRLVKDRDPLGYCVVDLAQKSALYPVIQFHKKFRITDYHGKAVSKHHNFNKNEYLIPKTILSANFFLNVPKLKTHRKAGITCAMKNLIGINGDKSWIAHHRAGACQFGGDEYPRFHLKNYLRWHLWAFLKSYKHTIWLAKLIKKLYYKKVTAGKTIESLKMTSDFHDMMEGSWYGNDTIWRCIADLNHIIFFADINGQMHHDPVRNYLTVVDAVIAGENEGPMQNMPKNAGIILSGFNPLMIDYIAT